MSIELPSHCRKTILSLEIPLAGHLGQKKTAERILQRFYWPTLFKDVREMCKTCPECQRTAIGKTVQVPDTITNYQKAIPVNCHGHCGPALCLTAGKDIGTYLLYVIMQLDI